MNARWPAVGVVHTETVVHTPPERYVSDAPYQLAILESPAGGRVTVRVATQKSGGRAQIGDKLQFLEERDGVPFYSKVNS